MWKVLSNLVDLKLIARCDQCGALLPFLRDEAMSVQSFRWACSPACYEDFIDELVWSASPDADAESGADWEDTLELMRNAGAGPSLRMQMESSMEKWRGEFTPGELAP